MVARVAMLLYGFSSPTHSPTFDWISFAETYQYSPRRAIALTSQWLLSQIRSYPVIADPSTIDGDWVVVRLANVPPFRMILVDGGETEINDLQSRSDSVDKRLAKPGKPFWLCQAEVNEALMEAFFTANPDLRNGWEPNTQVERPAGGVDGRIWLRLCNWLSDLEELSRCYYFTESSGCQPTNFEGVWFDPQATGFRIPTHRELQLAATNGDFARTWSYATYAPYSTRVSPPSDQTNIQNIWSILPDAWSFQGLFGNSYEIVMKDRNHFAISTIELSQTKHLETAISNSKPENFSIVLVGARLAKNAIHTAR